MLLSCTLLSALALAQLNEANVFLTYILLPVHVYCKTTNGILKYPLKYSSRKDESPLHAELLFSQLHHGFCPAAQEACTGT